MNVTVEASPDGVRVLPRGYVDLDTVRPLRERVEQVPPVAGQGYVLDLAGVEFLDSAGLTFLVWLHRWVAAADARLEVVGVRPEVARVLRLTGVDLFLGTSPAPSTPSAGRLP